MKNKPDAVYFLDDCRGIYIPRDFARCIKRDAISGIDLADLDFLAENGPDHDAYWDTWSDVCDKAIVTDDKGQKFRLYQDGALWLIPEGMEWDDKEQWFVWPATDEDQSNDA